MYQVADYIPMASISPINRKIDRHLIIALKAYCDGSGKRDDPNSDYLTLGGCIATPEAWTTFELRWAEILERHCSPPLHMKDAYHGKGDFKDWTRQRVNALLVALLNECFTGVSRKVHPDDFYFASCTVNLADYQRAARESSGVRSREPEALCAFHVTANALMLLPDDFSSPTKKHGGLELWFDQGERFQHSVQKLWEKRKKNRRDDVMSHIITIAPADYRKVIGLQAADFVAWHVNRHHASEDNWAGFVSEMAAPRLNQYWDYEGLMRVMPDGWTG